MQVNHFKILLLSILSIASFMGLTIAAQTKVNKQLGSGKGLLERALEGQAQIIDLTHPLSEKTPTYGGEKDSYRYERLSEIKKDGYASGAIRVPEHFGTHVDSPGHFIADKET